MNIIYLQVTIGDLGADPTFTIIFTIIMGSCAIYFMSKLVDILHYQKEGITKLSEAAEELKSEKLAEAGKDLLKAYSIKRILTNIYITLSLISIVGIFLLLIYSYIYS
jgi:hypothetical protein